MNIAERILRVPYVWESLRKMGLLKWRQERDYQRLIKAQKEIDARLAEKKKKGERVNVVFVCHRPQLWTTLIRCQDLCCTSEKQDQRAGLFE